MEIQQHDGVVVEAAGSWQGFAKLSERERCHGREREAPGAWVRLPSLPPRYIGPLGGALAQGDGISWGAASKGVPCPPRQVEAPPPLGIPNLGAEGGPRGGAPAP